MKKALIALAVLSSSLAGADKVEYPMWHVRSATTAKGAIPDPYYGTSVSYSFPIGSVGAVSVTNGAAPRGVAATNAVSSARVSTNAVQTLSR